MLMRVRCNIQSCSLNTNQPSQVNWGILPLAVRISAFGQELDEFEFFAAFWLREVGGRFDSRSYHSSSGGEDRHNRITFPHE